MDEWMDGWICGWMWIFPTWQREWELSPHPKNLPYRFAPYPQQPIGSGSGHLPLAGTRASLALTDHGLSFMKSSSARLSFAFLSANCSLNSARICISECTNSPILVSRTFPLNFFSPRIFFPVVLGWVFFFWFFLFLGFEVQRWQQLWRLAPWAPLWCRGPWHWRQVKVWVRRVRRRGWVLLLCLWGGGSRLGSVMAVEWRWWQRML